MSKVLVVEVEPTGESKKTHYRAFKERGLDLYFLICSPDLLDMYRPHVRIPYENSVAAFVSEAQRWHEDVHFDAVVTMSEFSVMATAAIASALGLPGVNANTAKICRNKYLMRQAHQRTDVPHPPFGLADDLETALHLAEQIGYPVIIKPTLGASSEHIYRIDNEQEMLLKYPLARTGALNNSFAAIEPRIEDRGPNSILVEGFLNGSEHSLEAFIWDGEVYIGAIGDRLSPEGQTFDNDIYTMPTRLSDVEIAKVREVVRKAAVAQGIMRGVVHPEIRYHNGAPYLVEMAVRAGGGPISHMTRTAYGYCAIQSSFDIALGKKPALQELSVTGTTIVAIAMTCDEGVIEEIIEPVEAQQNPNVIYFQIFLHPGDINRRPPNGNDLLGQITAAGASVQEAYALAERVFSQVEVKLSPAPVS